MINSFKVKEIVFCSGSSSKQLSDMNEVTSPHSLSPYLLISEWKVTTAWLSPRIVMHVNKE